MVTTGWGNGHNASQRCRPIKEGRQTWACEPDLPFQLPQLPRRPRLLWWQRDGTQEAGGVPITNPHGGILVADNQHRGASVVVQETAGNLGNLSLSGSRPASGGHSSHPYRSWFCGSASWARLGWARTHSSSQRPPASPRRQGPASPPPADRPGRVPRGSSVPGREEDARLLEDGAQDRNEDNPPRPVSPRRPPAQPRGTVTSHRAALVERALQTDLRRAISQSATKAINKDSPGPLDLVEPQRVRRQGPARHVST